MLLKDVKFLIIENEKIVANTIKEGLTQITSDDGLDNFDKDNVHIHFVKHTDLLRDVLCKLLKKIEEKKIDVLFIDLDLIESINDGIKIIENFIKKDIELSLPMYIISSNITVMQEEKYNHLKHYVNFIHKGKTSAKSYKEKFLAEQFSKVLPDKIQKYRKIKELSKNGKKLDIILDNTNHIKEQMESLNSKIVTIIQSLPQLLDSNKKKDKLEEFVKNSMSTYLSDASELDALFEDRNQKEAMLKVISDNFNEVITGGMKKESWQVLKGSIENIAEAQGIKEENIGICTLKLLHQAVSVSYKFFTEPEY